MKSSFKSRNGHDRMSNSKKTLSYAYKSRRTRVIERLENQLKLNIKTIKGSFTETISLTDNDRKRIENELTILKTRI